MYIYRSISVGSYRNIPNPIKPANNYIVGKNHRAIFKEKFLKTLDPNVCNHLFRLDM